MKTTNGLPSSLQGDIFRNFVSFIDSDGNRRVCRGFTAEQMIKILEIKDSEQIDCDCKVGGMDLEWWFENV
jgi:hypothetical protein